MVFDCRFALLALRVGQSQRRLQTDQELLYTSKRGGGLINLAAMPISEKGVVNTLRVSEIEQSNRY